MEAATQSQTKRLAMRVLVFVEEDLPGLLMALIVVALTADVVGRYVFNHPLQSAAEVSLIAFIWLVYLAVAAVSRRGEHIVIDVLTSLLRARWQSVVEIVVQVITLGVMIYLIVNGLDYFFNGTFTKLTGTGMSKKFLELAIPVSAVFMAAYSARDLVRAVKGAVTGSFERPGASVEDEYADVDDSYLPDSLKEARAS